MTVKAVRIVVLTLALLCFNACSNGRFQPSVTMRQEELEELKRQKDTKARELLESLLDNKEGQRAAKEAIAFCDEGLPSGCYVIGSLRLRGLYGVEKDLDEAMSYLKKGCNDNYARACHALGDGYAMQEDEQKALYYYKRAASMGDLLGNFAVGQHYLKSDPSLSMSYFEIACDGYFARACVSLAAIYRERGGMLQAYAYEDMACDLGDSLGCYNSATRNYFDKRYDDALDKFTKSCKLGRYPSCERAIDLIEKDQTRFTKRQKEQLLENITKIIEYNAQNNKFL